MKNGFLIEDFKLKLDYLSGQYFRLWQRLGFLLWKVPFLDSTGSWHSKNQKVNRCGCRACSASLYHLCGTLFLPKIGR